MTEEVALWREIARDPAERERREAVPACGDDGIMSRQLRHCEQVMDDPSAPECLRFFLRVARGQSLPGGLPTLFATLKREFSGRLLAPVTLKKGQRVRVTDAGRFGDVGVTTDLEESVKYLARASVDELETFSENR